MFCGLKMNRSILKNLTLFQTILNKHNNVTCSANLIRFCSNDTLLKDPEQKEVKIPVPWGHIAGDAYKCKSKTKFTINVAIFGYFHRKAMGKS